MDRSFSLTIAAVQTSPEPAKFSPEGKFLLQKGDFFESFYWVKTGYLVLLFWKNCFGI